MLRVCVLFIEQNLLISFSENDETKLVLFLLHFNRVFSVSTLTATLGKHLLWTKPEHRIRRTNTSERSAPSNTLSTRLTKHVSCTTLPYSKTFESSIQVNDFSRICVRQPHVSLALDFENFSTRPTWKLKLGRQCSSLCVATLKAL